MSADGCFGPHLRTRSETSARPPLRTADQHCQELVEAFCRTIRGGRPGSLRPSRARLSIASSARTPRQSGTGPPESLDPLDLGECLGVFDIRRWAQSPPIPTPWLLPSSATSSGEEVHPA